MSDPKRIEIPDDFEIDPDVDLSKYGFKEAIIEAKLHPLSCDHEGNMLIAGNGTYLICPHCAYTMEIPCYLDDIGYCWIHHEHCEE